MAQKDIHFGLFIVYNIIDEIVPGGVIMAKISDIIFCLRATNVEGEGASAHTILTALTPEYVPGLFSFSIIVNLLDIDLEHEHKFKIDFISPSEEEVLNISGDLPIMDIRTNLPKEYNGINIAMDWNNVNFKSSGLYIIRVYVDDVLIKEKEIFVKGKNE